MHGDDAPTVWDLNRRMSAIEAEQRELRELVDGQESWSHRRRLHTLEDDSRAAELAAQALDAFREAQQTVTASRRTALRDWIVAVAAVAAVVVSVLAFAHGYQHPYVPSPRLGH